MRMVLTEEFRLHPPVKCSRRSTFWTVWSTPPPFILTATPGKGIPLTRRGNSEGAARQKGDGEAVRGNPFPRPLGDKGIPHSPRDLRSRCAPLHIPAPLRGALPNISKTARSSKLVALFYFVWRRVRDSNPRNLAVQQFSRLPPSTTRPTLHLCPASKGPFVHPAEWNRERDCKDRQNL